MFYIVVKIHVNRMFYLLEYKFSKFQFLKLDIYCTGWEERNIKYMYNAYIHTYAYLEQNLEIFSCIYFSVLLADRFF